MDFTPETLGLPSPNFVDMAVAVVVIVGALNGLRRGLSGELPGLIGSLLALALGLWCSGWMAAYVVGRTRLGLESASALVFVLVAVAVMIAMSLVNLILTPFVGIVVKQRGIEWLGGMVTGFVKAFVYAAVVIVNMNMWPHEYLNTVFGKESAVGTVLVRYLPVMRGEIDRVGDGVAERVKLQD